MLVCQKKLQNIYKFTNMRQKYEQKKLTKMTQMQKRIKYEKKEKRKHSKEKLI